jgi:hypothetical protein
MRTELLSDLSVIGYEIFLDGENIRLRYQKPDSPPESARSLIDELRKCKADVVSILKTCNNTIAPPKIVAPESIVEAIWVNPHKQGTPEARRESLLQCMEATWLTTFDYQHRRSVQPRWSLRESKPLSYRARPNLQIFERRRRHGREKLN